MKTSGKFVRIDLLDFMVTWSEMGKQLIIKKNMADARAITRSKRLDIVPKVNAITIANHLRSRDKCKTRRPRRSILEQVKTLDCVSGFQ